LEQLADNSRVVFRIACVFRRSRSLPDFDHSVSLHLYRIAQEAIRNSFLTAPARCDGATARRVRWERVADLSAVALAAADGRAGAWKTSRGRRDSRESHRGERIRPASTES
jgi:hypothetical protein